MALTIAFRVPGCRIAHAQAMSDTTFLVTAHARTRRARCPQGQQPSRRVHRYDGRSPHDLPITDRAPAGAPAGAALWVSCPAPCPQPTFAERVPNVVPTAPRRTVRLTTARQTLACATGGQAGARRSQHVPMPRSPATLLRIMRRAPCPPAPPPRVLGVDDGALRKGCVYGTLLLDLARRRRSDLRPDRAARTLRDWRVPHPQVELIARDRSTD